MLLWLVGKNRYKQILLHRYVQGIIRVLVHVIIKRLCIMKKIKVNNATKQGFIEVKVGGVLNLAFPDSKLRRGRVIDGGETTRTIKAQYQQTSGANLKRHDSFGATGVIANDGEMIRIRKLTPKECFRLQGFPDEYFERAAKVCSDTQLYKQAGNSVTVNVIYEIAKRLEV